MASARDSMETVSTDDAGVKLTALPGRSDDQRKKLEKDVRKTAQHGAFKELGGQFFETIFNSKNQMCNFPVTMVKYEGKIPKLGTEGPKAVPEDTYMIFEPQAVWNKKWLTHNHTEPEKRRGTEASMPDSYTNTEYYACLPNVVLKSTKYREMYIQKHINNFNNLQLACLKKNISFSNVIGKLLTK